MSEEQKNSKKTGDHFSEFSLDEFSRTTFTIDKLCEAIRKDKYGIKFHKSSDNSIGRINEFLEYTDFNDILIQKKGDLNWSFDVQCLISVTSKIRGNKIPFLQLSHDQQLRIKRLNRLLLEEAYPKETPKSTKFFIPPGLLSLVDTFENHYKVAKGEPILIIGPTGVGKSLFIHVFERLYREEHQDEKKHPIVKANCAHFGGDPNMVRSELFGHVEGAYTGAISDKKGLVEMADGGVLVLEEIGDLPLETQATLLTFIETGEYYLLGHGMKKKSSSGKGKKQEDNVPAGDIEKPQKANVQIVGLTNREDYLREDFNHRFFPFYVPPLYERREDILYYFYAMYPDLFDSMKQYEVLLLMAYPWPGNVREIERIGRLLRRKKEDTKGITFSSKSDQSSFEAKRLYNLDPSNPNKLIEALHLQRLYFDLKKHGVDVELLESILNKYQIGLKIDPVNPDINPPFTVGFSGVVQNEVAERYGLKYTYYIEAFRNAYRGLCAFGELFYQHAMSNVNLLDLDKEFIFGDPFDEIVQYPKDQKDRFQKLLKSIFEYLSGIKLNENDIISDNVFERDDFFSMLGESHPGNHLLVSMGFAKPTEEKEKIDPDIYLLKCDDLLKLYFQRILDRAQGNQRKAAELAGMKYTTFRDKLKEYEIEAGRKRKMESRLQ